MQEKLENDGGYPDALKIYWAPKLTTVQWNYCFQPPSHTFQIMLQRPYIQRSVG